ncbi:WxL domain-containing protein [Listeria kieliensis]
MKKEKLVVAILGGVAVLSLGAQTSIAAGDAATSQVQIKLQPGNANKPVDPVVPNEDPNDHTGETGNVGLLTIDKVTPFEFGEHELTEDAETFSITAKNPNIQVSDRRGEGQGWALQVGLSAFSDAKDTDKVLKGAELVIPDGHLQTTAGNVSKKPEEFAVKLEADGKGMATLMQADKDSGMGSWADVLDGKDIKLLVPAGNYSGEYSATLNWSLVDAPTK